MRCHLKFPRSPHRTCNVEVPCSSVDSPVFSTSVKLPCSSVTNPVSITWSTFSFLALEDSKRLLPVTPRSYHMSHSKPRLSQHKSIALHLREMVHLSSFLPYKDRLSSLLRSKVGTTTKVVGECPCGCVAVGWDSMASPLASHVLLLSRRSCPGREPVANLFEFHPLAQVTRFCSQVVSLSFHSFRRFRRFLVSARSQPSACLEDNTKNGTLESASSRLCVLNFCHLSSSTLSEWYRGQSTKVVLCWGI